MSAALAESVPERSHIDFFATLFHSPAVCRNSLACPTAAVAIGHCCSPVPLLSCSPTPPARA
eukprot:3161843-Alexandrium_andersonii.AAC.1